MVSGLPLVLDAFPDWAPQILRDTVASFSLLTHFDAIKKGVVDLRDVIFFISLIGLWLFINYIAIDQRRAG